MARPRPIDEELRAGLRDLLRTAAGSIAGLAVDVAGKGGDGLDLVTSVDHTLQARLEGDLQALLPGVPVIGEEGHAGDALPDRGRAWLVDPLDGTMNFVAGLPAYAIAVALIEDGSPVLAAVHDLPHGTTWSARAGGGAFRDRQALAPRRAPARLAVLSSGLLADLASRAPATLAAILREDKLRNLGCQSLHLCHAAEGRLRYVASREARAWDDLAGALIAREAGLHYGSYLPDPRRGPGDAQYSLCAPPELFESLAQTLAASAPRPS